MPNVTILKVDRHRSILCSLNTPENLNPKWFEAEYWRQQNKIIAQKTGRGITYFFKENDRTFVLRHYWRGGLIGRFVEKNYLYTGVKRTRVFREFDLLNQLDEWHLPVCKPIAAMICKKGLVYQGHIITEAIPKAKSLLDILCYRELTDKEIDSVASMLATYHKRGVFHADLNINNILMDNNKIPHLIDFDRGQLKRPAKSWQAANINRLERSFNKQKRLNKHFFWQASHWQKLLDEYRARLNDSTHHR